MATAVKLIDINASITCHVCRGYLIDACTITECLHSFCRPCIAQHFERHNFCPYCECVVHKTRPFKYLKEDNTLQDLVYKLVPRLFDAEQHRRRRFYAAHPHAVGERTERSLREKRLFVQGDDPISLSVEYLPPAHAHAHALGLKPVRAYSAARDQIVAPSSSCSSSSSVEKPLEATREGCTSLAFVSGEDIQRRMSEEDAKASHRRYLQCSASVPMSVLAEFIKRKYSLRPFHKVDILFGEECLAPEVTLLDVVYKCKWNCKSPLKFSYTVVVESTRRARKRPRVNLNCQHRFSNSSCKKLQSKSNSSSSSSPKLVESASNGSLASSTSSEAELSTEQKEAVFSSSVSDKQQSPSSPNKLQSHASPNKSLTSSKHKLGDVLESSRKSPVRESTEPPRKKTKSDSSVAASINKENSSPNTAHVKVMTLKKVPTDALTTVDMSVLNEELMDVDDTANNQTLDSLDSSRDDGEGRMVIDESAQSPSDDDRSSQGSNSGKPEDVSVLRSTVSSDTPKRTCPNRATGHDEGKSSEEKVTVSPSVVCKESSETDATRSSLDKSVSKPVTASSNVSSMVKLHAASVAIVSLPNVNGLVSAKAMNTSTERANQPLSPVSKSTSQRKQAAPQKVTIPVSVNKSETLSMKSVSTKVPTSTVNKISTNIISNSISNSIELSASAVKPPPVPKSLTPMTQKLTLHASNKPGIVNKIAPVVSVQEQSSSLHCNKTTASLAVTPHKYSSPLSTKTANLVSSASTNFGAESPKTPVTVPSKCDTVPKVPQLIRPPGVLPVKYQSSSSSSPVATTALPNALISNLPSGMTITPIPQDVPPISSAPCLLPFNVAGLTPGVAAATPTSTGAASPSVGAVNVSPSVPKLPLSSSPEYNKAFRAAYEQQRLLIKRLQETTELQKALQEQQQTTARFDAPQQPGLDTLSSHTLSLTPIVRASATNDTSPGVGTFVRSTFPGTSFQYSQRPPSFITPMRPRLGRPPNPNKVKAARCDGRGGRGGRGSRGGGGRRGGGAASQRPSTSQLPPALSDVLQHAATVVAMSAANSSPQQLAQPYIQGLQNFTHGQLDLATAAILAKYAQFCGSPGQSTASAPTALDLAVNGSGTALRAHFPSPNNSLPTPPLQLTGFQYPPTMQSSNPFVATTPNPYTSPAASALTSNQTSLATSPVLSKVPGLTPAEAAGISPVTAVPRSSAALQTVPSPQPAKSPAPASPSNPSATTTSTSDVARSPEVTITRVAQSSATSHVHRTSVTNTVSITKRPGLCGAADKSNSERSVSSKHASSKLKCSSASSGVKVSRPCAVLMSSSSTTTSSRPGAQRAQHLLFNGHAVSNTMEKKASEGGHSSGNSPLKDLGALPTASSILQIEHLTKSLPTAISLSLGTVNY